MKVEIREKTRCIIARIARVKTEDLLDDIRFREEAGVDSMMGLEILAACEREFSIKIDEAGLSTIDTIGAFIDHITALAGEKTPSAN